MNRFRWLFVIGLLLVAATVVGAQDEPVVIDWANDAAWHEAGQDALGEASLGATGIGVNTVIFTSTDSYQAAVRGALPTDDAFPLFDWWFGYRMKDLVDAGSACGCHRHLAKAHRQRRLPGKHDGFLWL